MLYGRLFLSVVFAIQLNASAATDPDDAPLDVVDVSAITAPRLTNLPMNSALYPTDKLPQVCCIHPYFPTFHAFPVVVGFSGGMLDAISPAVLAQIPCAAKARLCLNVQDMPWPAVSKDPRESVPLLRAHALFPSMGNRTAGIKVMDDAGKLLINVSSGNVHSHDAIASPNNFAIPALEVKKANALWSIVTHGVKTFVTRHVLLTTEQNEQLERYFFDKVPAKGAPELIITKTELAGHLTPRFFAQLLTPGWADFLKELGVTVE